MDENKNIEANSVQKTDEYEFSSLDLFSSLNAGGYYNATSFENWTYAEIKKVIENPMDYNIEAKELSRLAYNLHGIYANTIDYMVSVPTLQYNLFPRNQHEKYKEIRDKLKTVGKVLNIPKVTRDILKTLYIDGFYCGYLVSTFPDEKQILRELRKTKKNKDGNNVLNNIMAVFTKIKDILDKKYTLKDNFMVMPLDTDYCKIVDNKNQFKVIAYDMSSFDNLSSDSLLKTFKSLPVEFVNAYSKYKRNGMSSQWHVLDYSKTIVQTFKASAREPYGRPLGLSALLDMKLSDTYDENQYKLINELASSIYWLKLPLGEKKNECGINKAQQAQQKTAFKNAVTHNTSSDTAKISTLTLAPGADIGRLAKDGSLVKDPLYDQNTKKMSTDLGFASSALNASSEGGASYSSLQVNIDLVSSQISEYIEYIEFELTKVINEWIGIHILFNYIDLKFMPISWLNKNDFHERMEKLYMQGRGSLRMYIASAGVDPDAYLAMMDEELELGFDEKYKPHATSYTFSDSADKANPDDNFGIKNPGGREPKKDEDLTPNGIKTKNLGSNKMVKPSTK